MDKDTKINEMEITDEYVLANSSEGIIDIAKRLQELQKETAHGAVLITKDDKKVIGFITGKNIVDLVATGVDISEKNALEIITKDFLEVFEDETLGDLIPKLTEKFPRAIVVVNTQGECVGYFSKNDYKEALAILGVYDISEEPKTAEDWRTRGIALSSLGKKGEALKCFRKSLESSSDKETSWSNLAKKLEKLNRIKDSIMCYDEILSMDEDNDSALKAKGDLYAKDKTDNLAIQSYARALKINPQNIEALTNLGVEYSKIGETEKAIQFLDQALEIEGDTPEIWFKKGTVYDKAEQFEGSLECYNKAIELNDYYEDAWFNKCIALNKLGKNDEALQCLMKILMMNPNNENVRDTLNKFKEKGSLEMT